MTRRETMPKAQCPPYAALMDRGLVATAWIAVMVTLAIAPAAWSQRDDAQAPQTPASASDRALVAGICDLPPYSFQQPNGQWDGMAVQLWTIAAKQSGLRFEWRPLSLDELHDALESGAVDVAVTGLPLDSSRAKRFAFSQPFESSAIVIATRSAGAGGFLEGLRHIATNEILIWLVVLIAALLSAAVMIALLEQRRNPHFPGGVRGIGEGIWWSITTFSTVGYGDRVPITRAGRITAGAWMLVAFALMTILSGLIASSLTVGRLNPVVQSPEDLRQHETGALDRGVAAPLLRSIGVRRLHTFPDAESGLLALRDRQIDAFVADSTVLHFLLRQRRFDSLIVLPGSLERVFVALGYTRSLPLATREAIDQSILEAVEDPQWNAYLERLLGASDD